jgi:hypothetical protein
MPIPTPISVHDEPLPPDLLTTIQFNFEWRRLIVELLWDMQSETFWSGIQADIEQAVDRASQMIEDVYEVVDVQKLAARLRPTSGFATVLASVLLIVEWQDPALNARDYDYGGFYDAATPTVLTIPAGKGGIYNFSANVFWFAGAGGVQRFTSIDWNEAETIAQSRNQVDGIFATSVSGDFEVSPGDEIRLKLFSSVADTVVANLELHRVFN